MCSQFSVLSDFISYLPLYFLWIKHMLSTLAIEVRNVQAQNCTCILKRFSKCGYIVISIWKPREFFMTSNSYCLIVSWQQTTFGNEFPTPLICLSVYVDDHVPIISLTKLSIVHLKQLRFFIRSLKLCKNKTVPVIPVAT